MSTGFHRAPSAILKKSGTTLNIFLPPGPARHRDCPHPSSAHECGGSSRGLTPRTARRALLHLYRAPLPRLVGRGLVAPLELEECAARPAASCARSCPASRLRRRVRRQPRTARAGTGPPARYPCVSEEFAETSGVNVPLDGARHAEMRSWSSARRLSFPRRRPRAHAGSGLRPASAPGRYAGCRGRPACAAR